MTTKVEIKPGPKLDLAVAKAIGARHNEAIRYDARKISFTIPLTNCFRCGRSFLDVGHCEQDTIHCPSCRVEWDADFQAAQSPKSYSTDLNATFEAAEKVGLFDGGYRSLARSEITNEWFVKRNSYNRSPSPALAICAAILELKEDAK